MTCFHTSGAPVPGRSPVRGGAMRLAAAIACTGMVGAAPAAYLVDTGEGLEATTEGKVYNWCCEGDTALAAARFTLDAPVRISTVEAWVHWVDTGGSGGPGLMGFGIHDATGSGPNYFSDEPYEYTGLPGAQLFDRLVDVAPSAGPRWQVVGVDLELAAGDYWIVIKDMDMSQGADDDDGIYGLLPGGAPRPLERYFQHASDSFSSGWIDRTGYGWGFRVSAVPEIPTALLMALGLGALGLVPHAARRREVTSARPAS